MDIDSTFRQLYAQTYRLAASLITVRCRQTADIGDILQEVYLELYRLLCRRGTDYIKEPEAMIRRLVRQKLFRYYRGLSARKEIYPEPDEDGCEIELSDIEAMSVEEIVEDRVVLDWTDRYLAEKGEIYRKIFHLYYRYNVSVPDIARMLGMTEADVKNRLYRTLKEIRSHWKGDQS